MMGSVCHHDILHTADIHCHRHLISFAFDTIFTLYPRSIVISMSVCLSVCRRAHLRNCTSNVYQIFVCVTHVRGSVLLRRRCDMLCISGFMYDVTFARNVWVIRRHVDTVAASDVIASSYAGKRPYCVVLVASCPRPRRAPRLDESSVGAEPAMRHIASFKWRPI